MISKEGKQPAQAPPLFTATATSIIQDTIRLIELTRGVQREIVETIFPDAATFATVLLPLAHAENAMAVESHLLVFYKSVSADESLRDASRQAQKLLDDFAVETAMNESLFKLFDKAFQQRDRETVDLECCHYLQKRFHEHARNGMGLPAGSQRDRFRDIRGRISELTSEFRNNLSEDDEGIWFTVEELEGVPEELLSGLKRKEHSEDHDGNDTLLVTFGYAVLIPVLRYANRADTRKRVFVANENKCGQNVAIFKEVVVLRDEAARLLGYANHAAFRIQDKMAKTPETVDRFLSDLLSNLKDGGEREIKKLMQLKKSHVEARGEDFDGFYFLWDHPYYNRLMLEKQYSVDHQMIKEFFPLETTIIGMLEIFQTIFGLVFIEIVGEARNALVPSGRGEETVWHEDVQIFGVWNSADEGGDFAGYLYTDLYPRAGKTGGASNFNLVPGFTREDGTRQHPATALVCNFVKPAAGTPSLLRHDEVVLLFHELGHGIHDLVSKTAFARFHGTETVVDFGEAPSQMLENWCWTSGTLKSLSRHYSSLSPAYLQLWKDKAKDGQEQPPPVQLPDATIENLIAAKYVNGALLHLYQLYMGIFDMAVHEPKSHADIKAMDISATYNTIRSKVFPPDGPEVLGQGSNWGHGQTHFGHLMGEYDAGFYSYLFSKVYSADMFHAAFKADPMNPEQGKRYRHCVLEKGGSQDEMQTLSTFLGRMPQVDAFHEELGLSL